MTRAYVVADVDEATRAAARLVRLGHQVNQENVPAGVRLTIGDGPNVDTEEVLIREAPSARSE